MDYLVSEPHLFVLQTFANCLTAGIVKWALAYNVSLVANAHFTISAVKQHAKVCMSRKSPDFINFICTIINCRNCVV